MWIDILKAAWHGAKDGYRQCMREQGTFYTGAEIAVFAITALSAGVSAYGAFTQAQSQQNTLRSNAKIAEADAAQAEEAGRAAAARQRQKDAFALNSFGAKAGLAGVVAHEGSALLNELDFASQSELEAQQQQFPFRAQAAQKKTQASFMRFQASRISPVQSAFTSLIGSAGSIAGSFAGSSIARPQTGGGLNPNSVQAL